MNSTGAYDLMEREYVTAPPEAEDDFSLTKIAGRYNRSASSVARMARIHKWKEKRAAYRGNVSEITAVLDGEAYAERLHSMHGKVVEAAEVTLDTYIAAVKRGDVIPSAGDAAKLVAMVREIVNKPAGGGEGDKHDPLLPGINISPDSVPAFLERLAGAATRRLESGGSDGDLVASAATTGEGGRIRVR